MNGMLKGTIFFGPRPLGPWGGAKRSNIFQLQSQFQRFLNQTLQSLLSRDTFLRTYLSVFSQMKDIKHIRWDFHKVFIWKSMQFSVQEWTLQKCL